MIYEFAKKCLEKTRQLSDESDVKATRHETGYSKVC